MRKSHTQKLYENKGSFIEVNVVRALVSNRSLARVRVLFGLLR